MNTLSELEKKDQSPKSGQSTPAKKAKPAEQKPSVGARLSRYLREMRSELKKVSWPGRKQTMNNTGVVIMSAIVVGVFVWVFDAIFAQVISALMNLVGA